MKTNGKAKLKTVHEVKNVGLKAARDIKGGKKTAAERRAAFERFVRDKDLTDAEYWNVN
jgi:hypothetical protein